MSDRYCEESELNDRLLYREHEEKFVYAIAFFGILMILLSVLMVVEPDSARPGS